MASSEILVELTGVGVERDGRWLVRGIDLQLRRGEIVTLIGPNGSGKSTTAKTAIGIIEPSVGRVVRTAGLRVGYVPQKLAIDWTMPLSVERLMTLTSRHSRQEIEAALASVGVSHLAQAEVQRLSGGEFQRALLARALIRRPDLLVLDEPVQGVDVAGEAALYDLIRSIRDRTGCGILLISHDLHVVMAATDTVICLNGHVCCRGTPESVASSERYWQLFGHRSSPALALYRHHHDHTHGDDGSVTALPDAASDAPCGCDAVHHREHEHRDAHGDHEERARGHA
ncbi:metal ABC transporter ATP-binding protein [Consotaella salsifontis]|uniref:Zinc transport system ATP-binding protein n=1 Tax=Consotaella salsifontis TaxID=1365950 RepID=A0A1T4P9Z5_9HYPH|nr:metal ABC transporter ATP-binding protein [Consotaella salsifontis]SJZ88066.1 zinc transport system ATP-binding protein [Consotaella salsifontis]